MERRIEMNIATAFAITAILLFTFGILATIDNSQNYSSNSIHSFQHSILAYSPHFACSAKTTHSLKNCNIGKQVTVNHPKKKNTKISIFEGSDTVSNLPIGVNIRAFASLNIGDIQRTLNKQNELKATYCDQKKQTKDLQTFNNLCNSLGISDLESI